MAYGSSAPLRTSQAFIRLCVGCSAAIVFAGCGNSGSDSASIADREPLIIELEKIKYLHPTPRTRLDSRCGGLLVLGDVDGDECTDFVIAASAQGRQAAVDRGWIEAYSGRDGTRLWSVGGKSVEQAQAEGDEDGYRLEDISLVADLNGDGNSDIYCRNGWNGSTALLFSGRDGQRLGRFLIGRDGRLEWVLFSRDFNDDGVPDLAFRAQQEEALGIQVLSGTDLSPVLERFDIWPAAHARWTDWVLPQFSDVDSDGVTDSLLRRGLRQNNTDPVYTFEYAVLSGQDFSILRTFESERPRVGGTTHYAAAGDVNDDGIEDVLMTSSTGDGPDNHASSLRVISGADGAVVWKVLGTQLKGGRTMKLVDVDTGEQTELQPDVEFEAPVVSVPDLNGDGTHDVATLAFGPGSGRSARAVLLFSGADGIPLGSLQLPEDNGRIGQSLIALDAATEEQTESIAVSATRGDGQSAIAVFPLAYLSGTE